MRRQVSPSLCTEATSRLCNPGSGGLLTLAVPLLVLLYFPKLHGIVRGSSQASGTPRPAIQTECTSVLKNPGQWTEKR